ncbi:transcriptional regulator [Leptospirillum ferriphilum]|uniref:transcriptional regulator n=1 Tax=Leptospirillum ferriphilum TaxID=178606 RepID=UPI00068481D3|nr:transcriptional regulator [Leptospirillum ferriphilum]
MRIFNEDAWIKQKAEEENGAFVSAGCIGMSAEPFSSTASDILAARLSLSRFVQLARLKHRLSKEQFADKTKIPLKELVCIEDDDGYTPTLRTVHMLAQFLKVSHEKLLTLAGLAQAKDAQFNDAAVRFAAMSEPIRQLTREEQEAFDEFAKFLSSR